MKFALPTTWLRYLISIFIYLKMSLVTAIHNFKLVEITPIILFNLRPIICKSWRLTCLNAHDACHSQ